jgi:hypothetical protein
MLDDASILREKATGYGRTAPSSFCTKVCTMHDIRSQLTPARPK